MSEAKPTRRDPITERMEREAFVVLQHAFNVAQADPAAVLSDVILARDLAFEPSYLRLLIDHLAGAAYVRCTPDGRVAVTPAGGDYLRAHARQRRSVRRQGPLGGAPGLARWGPIWRGPDPG